MVVFWVTAGSAVLLAGLSSLLWARRPPPPLWPLLLACQGLALLWVSGDLWASQARSLLEKETAHAVLFTGCLWLVPAWWETTRRYVTWQGLGGRWLRSRWAALPLWLGAAAWLFAVTNPWHGQFIEVVVGARSQPRSGFALVSHGYEALAAATLVLCAWAALRHDSRAVRRKMGLLGAATVAPLVGNVLHLYVPGAPGQSALAVGLGFSSVLVIYGITRRRLFDPIPVGFGEVLHRDPGGVLLLDRGGRLLLWNPAAEKLLESVLLEPDMPLLKVLARRLQDPRSGQRLEGSRDLTHVLTDPEIPAESRVFRCLGGGSELWLRMSVTPIPSRRRRLAAVCLRIEDVTREELAARSRRSRDDRLRRAETLDSLALLAGGVAHDFNNILQTVLGRVRIALDDAGRGLPVQQHLRAVLDAVELAGDLTEQLGDCAGRTPRRWERVDLSALIAQMQGLLGDCVPAPARLDTHLAVDLPEVAGDASQLRQVVLNLVRNAGEAIGHAEGVVTVRTARVGREGDEPASAGLHAGEYALLEVEDSGPGLDEEKQRRVFDAFFTTKPAGRGLGLAVVSRIVQAHRGAISLESPPGCGATFRVWLPAAPKPSGAAR